ncbi:MAG: hypothetical protein HC890_05450 [Chloroflexaceae bacterium]|nr:hypothetical protein [Chloroflexaceae bacterium]
MIDEVIDSLSDRVYQLIFHTYGQQPQGFRSFLQKIHQKTQLWLFLNLNGKFRRPMPSRQDF